jgi:hypothetical protein
LSGGLGVREFGKFLGFRPAILPEWDTLNQFPPRDD